MRTYTARRSLGTAKSLEPSTTTAPSRPGRVLERRRGQTCGRACGGHRGGRLGEPEKGAASRLTAPLFLLHHASLSRTRSTVAACHLPPAGVATLRRFSSSAAFRADRPASSTNSGRSCSARSRAACRSAMPFAFRPPNLTPRFFTLLVGVPAFASGPSPPCAVARTLGLGDNHRFMEFDTSSAVPL